MSLVSYRNLTSVSLHDETFSFNPLDTFSFHFQYPSDCRHFLGSPLNLTLALCGSAWGSQLSPRPLTTRALHQTVFGPPLPLNHPPSFRSWLSPPLGFQDQRVSRCSITKRFHRGRGNGERCAGWLSEWPAQRWVCSAQARSLHSPAHRHMLCSPQTSAVTHWP